MTQLFNTLWQIPNETLQRLAPLAMRREQLRQDQLDLQEEYKEYEIAPKDPQKRLEHWTAPLLTSTRENLQRMITRFINNNTQAQKDNEKAFRAICDQVDHLGP